MIFHDMSMPDNPLSDLLFLTTKPPVFFPQKIPQENLLDRSQLQALVEYQKSAAPGVLAEGQAEMLIGNTKPLGKSTVDLSGKVDVFRR